jgi:hypothetical protein
LRDVCAGGSEPEGFAVVDFAMAASVRAFGCGGFRRGRQAAGLARRPCGRSGGFRGGGGRAGVRLRRVSLGLGAR